MHGIWYVSNWVKLSFIVGIVNLLYQNMALTTEGFEDKKLMQ